MPRRAAAGKPPTYSFVEVPDAAKRPPLGDSMVEVPATRQRWLGMKDELKGLCDEAVRRRALKLLSRGARPRTALASAGAPLYEAYIADRLDLDDPLDGLVVRHRVTGWLQGFVTRTTFTTWTPHFMWDSRHHAAGLKGLVGSGRKLDSGVARGRSGGGALASATEANAFIDLVDVGDNEGIAAADHKRVRAWFKRSKYMRGEAVRERRAKAEL